MEEALQSLINFLDRIHEAEREADSIRASLLSQVGAKRKIFIAIDQDQKAEITSDNIVEFCRSFEGQCGQSLH